MFLAGITTLDIPEAFECLIDESRLPTCDTGRDYNIFFLITGTLDNVINYKQSTDDDINAQVGYSDSHYSEDT